MAIADTIAQLLGYQGQHFRAFDAADAQVLDAAGRQAERVAYASATFAYCGQAYDGGAAIEHLAGHAPVPQREIGFRREPDGIIDVNRVHAHDVLGVRRRMPGGRLEDGQDLEGRRYSNRTRAVWLGAVTCPSSESPSAGVIVGCFEEDAASAERGGRVQVHPLRTAYRARLRRRRSSPTTNGSVQPGLLERLKMCAECR